MHHSVCVLKEAFSDQWFLLERLTAREKESGLAKDVLEGIDSQVKDMLASYTVHMCNHTLYIIICLP